MDLGEYHGGRSLSRDIDAMKMRGMPSWNTSSTEVIPATAPAEMTALDPGACAVDYLDGWWPMAAASST